MYGFYKLIMSELWLESGNTVKYSLSPLKIPHAPPSGFPSGPGYISPCIPPVTILVQYSTWQCTTVTINAVHTQQYNAVVQPYQISISRSRFRHDWKGGEGPLWWIGLPLSASKLAMHYCDRGTPPALRIVQVWKVISQHQIIVQTWQFCDDPNTSKINWEFFQVFYYKKLAEKV